MDYVKEAFQKVKEDITSLKENIKDLSKELQEIQLSILELTKITASTHDKPNKTLRQINQTDNTSSTHPSTHISPLQSLKQVNMESSIGNEGVSTDRQTDRQTDRNTQNTHKIAKNERPDPSIILSQLDSLKKDIRLKIKRLTTQEMLVFSSIYQFEDQGQIVDYSFLSTKLNLSESSIRDYVQRITHKGIPITKEKINNKRIILHISVDLKKLATLNTLLELREL